MHLAPACLACRPDEQQNGRHAGQVPARRAPGVPALNNSDPTRSAAAALNVSGLDGVEFQFDDGVWSDSGLAAGAPICLNNVVEEPWRGMAIRMSPNVSSSHERDHGRSKSEAKAAAVSRAAQRAGAGRARILDTSGGFAQHLNAEDEATRPLFQAPLEHASVDGGQLTQRNSYSIPCSTWSK
jgi:hypothetical protein